MLWVITGGIIVITNSKNQDIQGWSLKLTLHQNLGNGLQDNKPLLKIFLEYEKNISWFLVSKKD